MTEQSIHPPPAIGTEDVERLITAARAALRYLEDLDKHGPIDLPRLGGEGRVRKQLRDAIRLASFDSRDCPSCSGGGTVPGRTDHPMQRPEPADCPDCNGSGERRVFAYERPKARQGH